ncbi:MAG TPA: AarF/UbiB family protein [Gemmatimonadaceae bacterium]|nr:AarF/UbiB family protein [Gemmatimonadaceae bacterium]
MLLAPRYIPRLAAMVGLFTRYGLRDFAQRQGLHALVPEEFDPPSTNGDDVPNRAAAFRKRLVELGPAYVKLGQVLSTRPDLLPEAYIRELTTLQDDVGAIPLEDVQQVIEEELRAKTSKLFSAFEEQPLGTASLGQVHGARLRDGRDVVVKVQRPGIRQQLADDIEFFHELARFMTSHSKIGERIDMLGIIVQLQRALTDELDYRIEARNAAAFRKSLAPFPHLLVPRVIEGYTTERVLTTERIRGVKIDDIPPISRAEHDFSVLAEEFGKGYLRQITIDGHFHADPHPGNVFVVLPGRANPWTPGEVAAADRRATPRPTVTPLARLEQDARDDAALPADAEAPKLALIDFGMTAHLSDALREHVVRFLLHIADNRGDSAAETLIEMGQPLEGFDRGGYVREIASLISRNYDRAVGEIRAGNLIYDLINASYERGLRLPAELTLLAKAMFNLDAVSRALDPGYSPVEAIREFGNQIAAERVKRELSPGRIYQIASQSADFLSSLPHRLDVITARLAANELALRVDTPQLDELLQGLQKIANRVFSGLVLGGIVVASAMLLPYYPRTGVAGFVIAGAIGVYMVISMLITDRHAPKR